MVLPHLVLLVYFLFSSKETNNSKDSKHFSLIDEHSSNIEYFFNKFDQIIRIKGIIFPNLEEEIDTA